MAEEFCKQRAKQIRELAAGADPFIKKRLLDLAANYDRRIRQPSTPRSLS